MSFRFAGTVRFTAFLFFCLAVAGGVSVSTVSAEIVNSHTAQNESPISASYPSPSPSLKASVLNQTFQNGMPLTAQPEKSWPDIISKSAIVMDLSTGTVLYAKDPLVAHYPASITKIMTAMIALQRGKPTDELSASQNAVSQPSDKLYMIEGETHTLNDLLYALLLDSANDAAVEIAENYGGSVSGFASIMNQEAVQLGAVHTHFENPNGLPDVSHVTTAYDMALITRAAMQIPEFRDIVQTKMIHWHGQAWQSDLWNLNRMLFYYPGAVGVKTGYTSVAHETLVFAATRQSQSFLVVLMDTPTDFEIRHDASSLLDYAFSHYKTETFLPAGMSVGTLTDVLGQHIGLLTAKPVIATVDTSSPLSITSNLDVQRPAENEKQGFVVGTMAFSLSGVKSGDVPIEISQGWQTPKPVASNGQKWVIGTSAAGILCFGSVAFAWRRSRRRKTDIIDCEQYLEHID